MNMHTGLANLFESRRNENDGTFIFIKYNSVQQSLTADYKSIMEHKAI